MEKIKIEELKLISKTLNQKGSICNIPEYKYLIRTEKNSHKIMFSHSDLLQPGAYKNFFITKKGERKVVTCYNDSFGKHICSYHVVNISKEKVLELLVSLQ